MGGRIDAHDVERGGLPGERCGRERCGRGDERGEVSIEFGAEGVEEGACEDGAHDGDAGEEEDEGGGVAGGGSGEEDCQGRNGHDGWRGGGGG